MTKLGPDLQWVQKNRSRQDYNMAVQACHRTMEAWKAVGVLITDPHPYNCCLVDVNSVHVPPTSWRAIPCDLANSVLSAHEITTKKWNDALSKLKLLQSCSAASPSFACPGFACLPQGLHPWRPQLSSSLTSALTSTTTALNNSTARPAF